MPSSAPLKPVGNAAAAIALPTVAPKPKPSIEPVKPPKKADSEAGRMAYSLRIKIGDLEFSNLKGDFLGTPILVLSTRQVGQIDFVLNELSSEQNQSKVPEIKPIAPTNPVATNPAIPAVKTPTVAPIAAKIDLKKPKTEPTIEPKKAIDTTTEDTTSLWSRIKAQEGAEVQIEAGFAPLLYNKLVGKAYRIGRRMPDGIVIEIVDMSTAAQSTAPIITSSTDPNTAAANSKPPIAPTKEVFGPPAPIAPTSPAKAIAVSAPLPVSGNKSPAKSIAAAATSNSKILPTPSSQSIAKNSGLKFEKKSDAATGIKGSVGVNTSALSTAVKDAAKQGDVIIVDGNTVKQVAPGEGSPTGLILDWNQHKSIFVRKPTVMKKTPNHLAGGAGVMAVQGWDVNGKQSIGGFAVVPGAFTPVAGGVINVPEWGALKMSDPIIPGCLYTWGDATKEGNRVPQSKAIIKGIIEIATQLMVFHGQGMNGGKKCQVNSWYRDPISNAAAGGSKLSTHMHGFAVDLNFPTMGEWLKKLHPEGAWKGGVASMSGVFIHIDMGGISDTAKVSPGRRWNY